MSIEDMEVTETTAGGESVEWPSETLLYRSSTRACSEGPALVKPRANFAAAVLGDGRIYKAGGYANGHELDVTEIYDPADRSFSTAKALPGAYDGMAAVDTLAGVVMVIGGNGHQSGPQTGVLWYRLAERSWDDGPPLPTHRAEAAAVRASDGLIWVAGGSERNGGVRFPSKRLDVFAP